MRLVHGGAASMGLAKWGSIRNREQPPGSARLPAPTQPSELAAYYDLTISHPKIEEFQFVAFDRWLAQAAAERGLSCLLIHNGIASEVMQRLSSGRLSIGYHLDYFALWHVNDDPLARLAFAVQDAGGRPVNPPARSRTFTDKASAHAELLRHGLGVPATVLLRPWSGDRPLTVAERLQLRLDEPGARLYLKPANGFSGRGIVRVEDVRPANLAVQLAAARQFDRQDTYLIQREVRFPRLPCEDGISRPAYWRILSYLGELTVFWWSPWESAHPERPSYRAVTETELQRHRLQPLLAYAQELDHLSGLDWFSTELCLSDGPETSRFTITGADGRERPVLAIDYLNDQCDVDVQSRWQGAPPDAYVYYLAEQFAQEAWRLRQLALRPTATAAPRAA